MIQAPRMRCRVSYANGAAGDNVGSADSLSFGVPDPGLRDSLREAREAIILAEALLEVKGN